MRLITNPRWSTRPPSPLEVDWSSSTWRQHPLARGLTTLIFPGSGPRDYANGNVLTPSGSPVLTPNATFGPAWRLRGNATPEYFRAPLTRRANQPKTIAMWIRGVGSDGYLGVVSSRIWPEDNGSGFIFIASAGQLQYGHTGNGTHACPAGLTSGVPYLCVATTGANASDVRLYVNGQGPLSPSTNTITPAYDEAYDILEIGRQGGAGGGHRRAPDVQGGSDRRDVPGGRQAGGIARTEASGNQ